MRILIEDYGSQTVDYGQPLMVTCGERDLADGNGETMNAAVTHEAN
jgi:hypothetical protein